MTPVGFTNRANPLPEGLLGAARLRAAMDAMYYSGMFPCFRFGCSTRLV